MRINYTMFSTGLTGGSRTFFEISNRLVDRGHQVYITTLGVPRSTSWFKPKARINYVDRAALVNKALEIFSAKMPAPLKHPLMEAFLNRQLKLLRKSMPDCDVNVATYCMTAYPVIESGKGVPFYHMQHYEPLFFKEEKFRLMAERTYELPFHRIANSTWLKKKLDEIQGIKDTPVINHAIDHDIFYPRSKKKSKRDKLRVVSLGKMADWKGIYDIFNAMELVLKERNDVEFVLYGTKRLPAKFSKVPHIYVLSPSDNELAELYSDSDVLASASWYESFPLPPLEAMACGLPVITTPYGTEDYAFDGVNAVVVPPKNPKVLAEAIIRLLDDKGLKEKLSREGLNTAKKFTWDKTTDKVEELFENALK